MAGCDFANLHDGKGAFAWSMRCNTVEGQVVEIVSYQASAGMLMLSFLCWAQDRVQMVALATWQPLSLSRSPDAMGISCPFAMKHKLLRRYFGVKRKQLEDESVWRY